jgi:hypothetical protein
MFFWVCSESLDELKTRFRSERLDKLATAVILGAG